jgi:hypothetical protein
MLMPKDVLTPKQIDDLIAAGGKFSRTLSTKSEVMKLMMGLGYTEAEHALGWSLYIAMLGFKDAGAAAATMPAASTDQFKAFVRIDAFDEGAFRRASAAMLRLHKDQYDYMFGDGLAPAQGPESIGTVSRFLDRYAALRDGTDPNRSGKKAEDNAAAKTLEQRNIVTPEIEKSLRADIALAQKLAPAMTPVQLSASEEELQIAAQKFNEWFHDWRTTASVGITRRDYRIMLGLSQRKHTADSPASPAPTPDNSNNNGDL